MTSTLPRLAPALILNALFALGAASSLASELTPRLQPLFNEQLSNAIKPDGVWSMEEGVLTATEDQNIWTETVYEEFMLDLEFRNFEGTNSGVIVYCSDTGNWIPNSVEIQIADDHSEPWKSADPSWQCGAFFGHKRPVWNGVVAEPGQWNRMRVYASGKLIAVELNGELVNAIDLSRYTSAEVAPDGTEIPEWLSKPWSELSTQGRIGFQGKHAGAPIEFRNISIRSLSELEQVGLAAAATALEAPSARRP